MTNEYKKTLCDIEVIVNQLNETQRNKIPTQLRKLIHNNQLSGYQSNVQIDVPLEEQNLSELTKAFLAMLYMNYWCEDEEEKKQLKQIWNENEEQYQLELAEKYNVENIFKARNNYQNEEKQSKEETAVTKYKESIFKRILNKIFGFFRKG